MKQQHIEDKLIPDWLRLVSVAVTVAALQACGGGSGQTTPPVSVTPTQPGTPAPTTPSVKSLQLTGKVDAADRLKGGEVRVLAAAKPYSTTVAADGSFTVTLKDYAATDFISVRVKGVGRSSGLELASLAGTAGALETLGGNDGSVDAKQASRLDISSLDTTRAGLIVSAKKAAAKSGVTAKADNADSPVQSDSDLNTAEDALDPQRVVQVATAIQVLIDNAEVPAPEGGTYAYTQQTEVDQGKYGAALRRDYPQAFENASASVAAADALALTEAQVPQRFFFIAPFDEAYPYVGTTFRFNADKSGTASNSQSAERAISWQVADNSLKVSYAATTGNARRDRNGNGDPYDDAPIQSSVKRDDRFFVGAKSASGLISIVRKRRFQTSFPNKEVPDEDYTLTDAGFGRDEADAPAAALYFKTADLAGKTLALDSSSRLDANGGQLSAASLRADTNTRRGDELSFFTGGSGSSKLLGDFQWSIGDGSAGSKAGQLNVKYANGDIATYEKVKLLNDGVHLVRRSFESTTSPAYRVATAGLMVEVDAAARLSAFDLTGVYHYSGVGSLQPAEAFESLTINLEASGDGTEVTVSSYDNLGRPGGKVLTSDVGIYRYSLSSDRRTLVVDSTEDLGTGAANCDPDNGGNCGVSYHRELHVLKIAGSRIHTRFYETFPAYDSSVASSIMVFEFVPAQQNGSSSPGSGGNEPPATQMGFRSTDDLVGAYAAALFSADFDFVEFLTPSPLEGGGPEEVTYPSSGNCSAGGNFVATADDGTAYTYDGQLVANNCQTAGNGGRAALLDGQVVVKCIESAQTSTTCKKLDVTYGTSSQRLRAANDDGSYDSTMFFNVVHEEKPDENSYPDTLNGDVQTRPDPAGATLTFSYENFVGNFINNRLVVGGTFTVNSTDKSNCFAGKVTVKTNAPIDYSGYYGDGGKITLTDIDGDAGTVVFNSNKTVTATFQGVTKNYPLSVIDDLCR